MKQRYLEVTYRRGKALAAYLYLPRKGHAKVARTAGEKNGLKVDFDADGSPMGIEITRPLSITVDDVNAVLARLGLPGLPGDEWAPLRAA